MKIPKKTLFFLVIFLVGFLLFQYGKKLEQDKRINVAEDHPMMVYFSEINPFTVQAAEIEDLTDDGKEDLLVIWRDTIEDFNYMAVVTEENRRLGLTEKEKAPYENLSIEFKNIDKEGVMEFIVSGSRLGNYGYGIYRVEDGAVVNIFGEGLEDC